MPSRKVIFANEEYYHICNRGTQGTNIFADRYDVERFLQSIDEFNSVEPVGSIFENSFRPEKPAKKLVNLIAYCLNPNHFHLLLEQVSENGIMKYLQRLGGYSWYFNKKYQRKGTLFQGRFQARHITSNDYLLHVSAYVNLNNRVHQLGGPAAKLVRSSWDEYAKNKNGLCKKDIILSQFSSSKEYENYALETLELMIEKKREDKELKDLMLEN